MRWRRRAARRADDRCRPCADPPMYLLDTNVVAELRKRKPHGAVVDWLASVEDHELHLSVVSLGEIQAAIELARGQDADKAGEIEAWLDLVAGSYNVVPVDAATMRLWARLMHGASDALYEDALIAATARTRGLTVVTRHVGDFARFGVALLNPFKPAAR